MAKAGKENSRFGPVSLGSNENQRKGRARARPFQFVVEAITDAQNRLSLSAGRACV